MLIEFTVANFRSFKDRQSLSLVASSGSEHREQNVSTTGVAGLDLLRTAALYGPNAAGKSNLFHALRTLQVLVQGSGSGRRRCEGHRWPGVLLTAGLVVRIHCRAPEYQLKLTFRRKVANIVVNLLGYSHADRIHRR